MQTIRMIFTFAIRMPAFWQQMMQVKLSKK